MNEQNEEIESTLNALSGQVAEEPSMSYQDICLLNITIAKKAAALGNHREPLDVLVSDVRGSHPKPDVIHIIKCMAWANILTLDTNPAGMGHVGATDSCRTFAQFADYHVVAWDLIDYAWPKDRSNQGEIAPSKLPAPMQSDPILLNAGMQHLVDAGLVKNQISSRETGQFDYVVLNLTPNSRSVLNTPELLLNTYSKPKEVTMTTNNFSGDNQANNLISSSDGNNIQQNASVQSGVQAGDLTGLIHSLTEIGVGQPEIDALTQAIKDDGPSQVQGTIGKKVGAWVGEMVQKALTGTWNAATSKTHELLVTAIQRYYGLP